MLSSHYLKLCCDSTKQGHCGAVTLSRLRRQELNLYAAELNLYAAEQNLCGAATLEATSSNALLSGLHAHAEAAKDEALQQLADQASLPCRRLYLCDCVTV
jgi:hypothetical protein